MSGFSPPKMAAAEHPALPVFRAVMKRLGHHIDSHDTEMAHAMYAIGQVLVCVGENMIVEYLSGVPVLDIVVAAGLANASIRHPTIKARSVLVVSPQRLQFANRFRKVLDEELGDEDVDVTATLTKATFPSFGTQFRVVNAHQLPVLRDELSQVEWHAVFVQRADDQLGGEVGECIEALTETTPLVFLSDTATPVDDHSCVVNIMSDEKKSFTELDDEQTTTIEELD